MAHISSPLPGAASVRVEPRPAAVGRTMALIGVGAFLTSLDNTIVGAAVPTIAADLTLSLDDLQWIGVAYMLPFALLLLAAGPFVDRVGARRALAAGLVVFGAGAVVAGLAGSATVLLVGRVTQGAAAALLVPALLSLLRTALPPARRSAGAAVWTACLAAALALGPAVGGLLSEYAGWRWVLWINVPFVLLMLALLPAPNRAGGPTARTEAGSGPHRGRSLLVTALIVQTLWGLGITGVVFYTPLVHQEWLGLAPLAAGLPLVLVAIGVAAGAMVVPRTVARFGPHVAVAAGLVAVGAGLVALAAVNGMPLLAPRVPALLLIGFGSAFTTPLTTVPLDVVDEGRAGVVSAWLTVSRELSSAAGVVVVSAVLLGVRDAVLARGAPPAASLASGYTVVLLLAATLQVIGAAVAYARLRPPPSAPSDTVPPIGEVLR